MANNNYNMSFMTDGNNAFNFDPSTMNSGNNDNNGYKMPAIKGKKWFDFNPYEEAAAPGNGFFLDEKQDAEGYITPDSVFPTMEFYWPNYGIQDFLDDRFRWQRMNRIGSVNNTQPGWYFFKIFFETHTPNNLFGGIVPVSHDRTIGDDKTKVTSYINPKNCALTYLYNIRNRYASVNIDSRIEALGRFGYMFDKMCNETPWIFKGINGLDQISAANITDIAKDKEIELAFNIETLDNRIATIFDLYKYACYDNVNCKEVIPANLRKFNMSVIIFHIPTIEPPGPYTENTGDWWRTYENIDDYWAQQQQNIENRNNHNSVALKEQFTKTMNMVNSKKLNNMMSFKMYSFFNCEFIPESLNTLNPSSMTNETPFQMDAITVKIKYDRVFEQRMNEWEKFIFGSTGFVYDNDLINT